MRNKEKVLELVVIPVIYISVVLAIVYGTTYLMSTAVKDYEIISANERVECIIVSRMFNTSVDCWEK